MPLFDASEVSKDDVMLEHVGTVNAVINRLREQLVDEILLRGPSHYMLLAEVQCFFQAHIRRALMFLEGGKNALDSGYGLIALSCARSLYESAACVHDFCTHLLMKLDASDFSGAFHFVQERSFSMRFEVEKINDGKLNFTAVNVLKQIDALSKVVPDARRSYEQLSEATHPNTFGARMFFEIEQTDGAARFGNYKDRDHKLMSVLIAAGTLLWLMEGDILQTHKKLLDLLDDDFPSS